MQHDLIISLLISLGITLILELLFCSIFKVRNLHDLVLVVLVNFLTNPPVVLTHYALVGSAALSPLIIVLLLETAVVIIEGFCYKFYSKDIEHPFYISLGANAFSYLMGLLIQSAF